MRPGLCCRRGLKTRPHHRWERPAHPIPTPACRAKLPQASAAASPRLRVIPQLFSFGELRGCNEEITKISATTYSATGSGAIPTTFTPVGAAAPHVSSSSFGIDNYSLAFDSTGNIYEADGTSTTAGAAGDGINVVSRPPANYTNNVLTSLTYNTLLTGSAISTSNGLINVQFSRPNQISEDGDGAIWVPDYAANTVVRLFGPTGTSIMAYYPCVAATCSTVYASGTNLFAVKQVLVDSTGTVDAMTTANGNWVQIFGVGTPSFPLLQSGHPAQMP